ncbi:hypothetical protein CBF34_10810 [Vagococcus penaei]|uniref:Uncharacterized protein n=1 Tax=Vagococcus penaei TaxID=633807 RepID=A0A1Q2D5K7_9ENTE|nr:hypothetical protein [Vagococcus penaei]AQP53686.1 hypothetical protein BW732_05165 [Vagococcus penaei]RST97700.1 hypothetical protein CBF34_10810 [Vagococcus penaei]
MENHDGYILLESLVTFGVLMTCLALLSLTVLQQVKQEDRVKHLAELTNFGYDWQRMNQSSKYNNWLKEEQKRYQVIYLKSETSYLEVKNMYGELLIYEE